MCNFLLDEVYKFLSFHGTNVRGIKLQEYHFLKTDLYIYIYIFWRGQRGKLIRSEMSSFIYTKRYQRHPEWLVHSLHSFSLHDPVPACIDIGFYRIGRLMRFRYFRHIPGASALNPLSRKRSNIVEIRTEIPCSQFCSYVNSFPSPEHFYYHFIIIIIFIPR